MIYYIYPCTYVKKLGIFHPIVKRVDGSESIWRDKADNLITDLRDGIIHFWLNYNQDSQCLCCDKDKATWEIFDG